MGNGSDTQPTNNSSCGLRGTVTQEADLAMALTAQPNPVGVDSAANAACDRQQPRLF